MARQINTEITGTIENVIHYKSRGQYLIRAKGNTGRQADVAKEQAKIMGKASAMSANLRAALKPVIRVPNPRQLMYHFNNVLQQWLRSKQFESTEPVNNIPLLQGFSFSSNSKVNDFFIALPITRVTNGLLLHIPRLDSPNPIHPLPFNGQINFRIMAAGCNVADPKETVLAERILEIDYNGTPVEAQEIFLAVEPKAGQLIVVSMMVNNVSSGIVGAMYN